MSREERQQSKAGDVQAAEEVAKENTQSNSRFVHVLRLIGGYFSLDPTNERLSGKEVVKERVVMGGFRTAGPKR